MSLRSNEVYMGEAGRIALDTTIGETDYVDLGHIRLGMIQSVANGLDVHAIEILDHRVADILWRRVTVFRRQ